ncbi:MAG: periplasmic heavy metal sensor [Sphingobacteriales bacterium]|nr:periplasmic heavy metal sensor [Sphingobacteriales bacterium]
MSTGTKNKLLTWLVILLLVANAATLAMFWLNKRKGPPPVKGVPNEFLIKELKLDSAQQQQLDVLVKEHRQKAEEIREKVRAAKDSLFELVKQTTATDSAKQAAAAACSKLTEELDVLTVNHFQKIRALCNTDQQKKFDDIIHDITRMMGQPQPPGRRGGPPPPGGPHGDGPPPPGQ